MDLGQRGKLFFCVVSLAFPVHSCWWLKAPMHLVVDQSHRCIHQVPHLIQTPVEARITSANRQVILEDFDGQVIRGLDGIEGLGCCAALAEHRVLRRLVVGLAWRDQPVALVAVF
jgi:hypothetical protein